MGDEGIDVFVQIKNDFFAYFSKQYLMRMCETAIWETRSRVRAVSSPSSTPLNTASSQIGMA